MRLILSQLPVSLTEEEIDEILRAGDTNMDGVFDLSEFGCGWYICLIMIDSSCL